MRRWRLRYKIFVLMGSLILGLLVVTLLVVGLQMHYDPLHGQRCMCQTEHLCMFRSALDAPP